MTYLAVERNVAASTQNQAFNSLLFFFRQVLKREPGDLRGSVRARRKPYIPVVLSRNEINAVLEHLSYPFDLVVGLLYGCGLRLFECLRLRINNFNLDARILTVHDGKEKKVQANYDIRTIQGLLGHSDVRTTMIYTHTIESRTIKEAKSPLDIEAGVF